MAQASSQWHQLVKLLQQLPPPEVTTPTLRAMMRSIYRLKGAGGWLFGLTVMSALLLWNWRLLLATGTGVGAMLAVYLMQEWDWQVQWKQLQKFLQGSNQQLTLAVASGGLTTLGTYMAVSIWLESENHWVASGMILQGLGTVSILSLVIGQILSRKASWDESVVNEWLGDLTATDSLKRLIAVRQLTALADKGRLDRTHRRAIADYLCLMLNQESETVVRDAVLDGLQVLEPRKQLLTQGSQPFSIPVYKKPSREKIRRRLS